MQSSPMLRGLTKKPGDRYATAEAFLAVIESALHTPEGGQTSVEFERPERDTDRPERHAGHGDRP